MEINRVYIPASLHRKIDDSVELRGDKELMQDFFKELLRGDSSCPVEITMVRGEDKKTNPQLRYFFGVMLPILSEAFYQTQGERFTKEDIVTTLKEMFFFEVFINPITDQSAKILGSFEKAKKAEIFTFISDVVNFGETIMGVTFPDSAKYKELKYGTK